MNKKQLQLTAGGPAEPAGRGTIGGATLICVVLTLIVLIVGCSNVGADRIRAGRSEYNAAIKDTDVDQLLLNIVRLRFSDKPYFLEIASISATSEVGGAVGGTSKRGLEAGISMFERPNIVYLPVDGEQFVRQLLEPVDLTTLRLLRGAGWEMDDIVRVFANYINSVPNAPTGSGSTPEGTPKYAEFLQVAEAMDELEDAGSLTLVANADNPDELVLMVSDEGRQTSYFAELARLLNLDSDAVNYRVRIGVHQVAGNEIAIDIRPILSAMFFLGQSIELPKIVYDAGLVNSGLDDGAIGTPFDWSLVHNELIRIQSSDVIPDNAYSAVQYGDDWYFVTNDDVDSKETLTMLGVVLSLKSGGEKSGGPLLTMPVGGG